MSLTHGGRPLSTGDSWMALMQASDRALRDSRLEHVVFGGWNVKPEVSLRKHREFVEIWPVYRRQLLDEPNGPVHEVIRVSALIWLVALLADRWRRQPSTPLRVAALLVLASGLG
ncbi:MAG: hypothetical protein GWN84_07370, partial [Gammaproteobacteria bacterium]|nr:hypothetical protein [Gammaproteobacteria bacterium]NIR82703.1 hypothetical protein [Gammaproteobacteria bacterium]NIU03863.1 hypothetical protein [Gammaproteobacteria bacterium]NIV51184.1 hypothetical protein [Gammaproteobacteria bacterium]NIX85137.1 hypothetical protein [Gammaproteobacteria bacterium]